MGVNAAVNSVCDDLFTRRFAMSSRYPGLKETGRERPRKLLGGLKPKKLGRSRPFRVFFRRTLLNSTLLTEFVSER